MPVPRKFEVEGEWDVNTGPVPGFINIDWLLERTTHEPSTDCLVWKGSCAAEDHPQTRITYARKKAKNVQVRKLVWRRANGDVKWPISSRGHVWHCAVTCGTPRCVSPLHVIALPTSFWVKGKPKSETMRARLRATKAKQSKISDQQVLEVLRSPEPGTTVSKRLGMSKHYASKLRRGVSRVHIATGIFSGLINRRTA